MGWLASVLTRYPELAVYLALALGYWVGGFKLRGFQLGGVTGSLLAGMLLGFWLNGRYTFAEAGTRKLGWKRFARFFGLWLLLTAASTLLVSLVDHAMGLQYTWLAKPLVEGGLACVSFLLMRYVVYR